MGMGGGSGGRGAAPRHSAFWISQKGVAGERLPASACPLSPGSEPGQLLHTWLLCLPKQPISPLRNSAVKATPNRCFQDFVQSQRCGLYHTPGLTDNSCWPGVRPAGAGRAGRWERLVLNEGLGRPRLLLGHPLRAILSLLPANSTVPVISSAYLRIKGLAQARGTPGESSKSNN